MIDIIKYPSERAERKISEIALRRPGADPELEARVIEIIRAVKSEGDAAVLRYARRFDAPGLEEGRLRVSDEEIDAACREVDSDFMSIIRTAIRNIEEFHKRQLRYSHFM
ncbi:MAG: histidinol dehydrogenase, partial [Deltaproteobacteria bacterium]|nr:histidinol dehydrogenase [Deltaproteobacteria bacterium]